MLRTASVAAALLLVLAGCSSDPDDETLTVFAAASLKGTFTELADQFENDHPGVTVELSFAGSSDLVAQIQNGAPADVLAAADTTTMDQAGDLVVDPVDFATNVLQIATPPDDPAGVTSLQDLARPGTQVVVCAPAVPCGSATVALEKAAGVDLRPVSEEQSVTDVLNKVISGEADAGLVYVTDVRSAGDAVRGVELPESSQVVNTYPIATVADSPQAGLAQKFVDLVTDPTGQAVLADAGFGAPPS